MKRKTDQTAPKDAANKEMISLNDRLINDFSIEELEARLETDPLMFLQVFGITTSFNEDIGIEPLCGVRCNQFECPEVTCMCNGYNPNTCSPVCDTIIGTV